MSGLEEVTDGLAVRCGAVRAECEKLPSQQVVAAAVAHVRIGLHCLLQQQQQLLLL